ncbi:MAG: MCE family protein [Deltaproteobacteria bacterium]|nr:MCE family protein [Deltaproteobacteria bacterium]
MEMRFEKKERVVGLFMVIVIALLLGGVAMVGRAKDWFRSYATYYTVFDEAYNLSPNARVKLYTVDVGKVKQVSLVGDKVRVELAVLKEYADRIKTDSVATVESPTVIGSEYVSIKPGSTAARALPEGGMIASKPKKSIADLMAEFEVEKTAKMVIKSIQAFTGIVERLRDPTGPLFRALESTADSLSHIEAVTRRIDEGRGSVGKLVASEDLLKKVYTQLDEMGRVLKRLEHTVNVAHDITRHVAEASTKAPEIMEALEQSLDTIRRILANIEQGSRDIPSVTRSTKRGLKEMREAVEQLDRVARALQETFFVRRHLPPEVQDEPIDTGLRR